MNVESDIEQDNSISRGECSYYSNVDPKVPTVSVVES